MPLRACLTCLFLTTLGFVASLAPAEEPDKKSELREVKVKDVTLKVPENWKQAEPTSRLRLAQFEIPAAEGEEGSVELVVSSFGGGGGGLQANLPRWVGEFQQEGRTLKVTTGKSPQGDYAVVEVAGTHVGPGFNRRAEPLRNARLVAMMLNVPEKGAYFLKVSGPEKTVASVGKGLRTAIGADVKDEKPYQPDAE